jgi:hypothetical protein
VKKQTPKWTETLALIESGKSIAQVAKSVRALAPSSATLPGARAREAFKEVFSRMRYATEDLTKIVHPIMRKLKLKGFYAQSLITSKVNIFDDLRIAQWLLDVEGKNQQPSNKYVSRRGGPAQDFGDDGCAGDDGGSMAARLFAVSGTQRIAAVKSLSSASPAVLKVCQARWLGGFERIEIIVL